MYMCNVHLHNDHKSEDLCMFVVNSTEEKLEFFNCRETISDDECNRKMEVKRCALK